MKNEEKILSNLSKIENLEIITDSNRLKRLSQDFNWYSPILKRKLEDKCADMVLRPKTVVALIESVGEVAKSKLPITIRGSGTGNYGQCVPLECGIVIDMSQLSGIIQNSENEITALSGTKLIDIDLFAKKLGKEIHMFPSTFRSASIGGFFLWGFRGDRFFDIWRPC